jgi:hypothetical protein
MAVSTSKNVTRSACRPSTNSRYGAMSSYVDAKRPGSSGAPSRAMRSVTRSRCGLVYRPVRMPNSRNRASIIRAVDVLPLVPVTWIVGNARFGDPSRSSRSVIRSRSGTIRDGKRPASAASTLTSAARSSLSTR